jgi:hypothetical protein
MLLKAAGWRSYYTTGPSMLGYFNDSCEADGMVEMENDIKAEGCLLKDTLTKIITTTHIPLTSVSYYLLVV